MNIKWSDLNWRFCVLTGLLALMITLSSQSILMKEARSAMEMRLGQKAAFINTFYSFLIADALQRKDDVTLLQIVNRLEEDQEITAVVVVDDKGDIRYDADPEKIGGPLEDPLVQKALDSGDGVMTTFQNSGGKALALLSPLKVAGRSKPIGAVRIDLTYRVVSQQLAMFERSFQLAALGLISMSIGVMIIFIRHWVTLPLYQLRVAIGVLNPITSDPNLPESPDDFGMIHRALNECLIRFRLELQNQQAAAGMGLQEEKSFAEQILKVLLPENRVILSDKENYILSDSGAPESTGVRRHLLDIITDDRMAALVGLAFQREGEVLRGPTQIGAHPAEVMVLRFPESQSKLIKTIIVLRQVPIPS